MAPSSRRHVTYVVPSPPSAIPRLRLPPEGAPRNGQTSPIMIPARSIGSEKSPSNGIGKKSRYPRHRLAVAAFALDTATQLVGRDSPEGILYSGGRDGMIMAWDLGMPMKPRSPRFSASLQDGTRRMGRWERLTIDEDDDNAIYEEDDDEWPISDGDVLGDVVGSSGRRGSRYWMKVDDVPYEQRWEIDMRRVEGGQPAFWRKHVQAHTDWVNDMLLCNLNQTVISGSSDGTVKAWNPNNSSTSPPSTVGTHSDYVRCLAQCQHRKWIASGSFDRTVKLWDISQPQTDPLVILHSPDTAGPKASVYALAADPFGHVVAAGGPERVIRTWDPRSGKRTGKLVGHTDNIRAMLMSEDSRYLLTGSADASIKLWSLLSPQRCIYTFTHHTESVWSLFSSHPALETFYSGDRSGIVCRVDVEECQHISQGECIALCKDTGELNMASSEGISKVIAMDDHLLWTASGSSSIRRWRVPQGRIVRAMTSSPIDERGSSRPLHRHMISDAPRLSISPDSPPHGPSYRRLKGESLTPSISASLASHESSELETEETTQNDIPYGSLIKLSAPNAHHGAFNVTVRGREAEVSTVYSAVSVKSVPRKPSSPSAGAFPGHAYLNVGIYGGSGRRDTLSPPVQEGPPFLSLNPRLAYEDRDVAPDATPLVSEPDFIIEGEHGLVRGTIMNDRIHALTVDTAGIVAVWDVVRCQCLGIFTKEDVRNAIASINSADGHTTNTEGPADNADKISPRQALELVRDRIEGEAVVNPWSNVDTRIGGLAIHILDKCFESEIFADEAGYADRSHSEDHRLNIGKWVLRNLFMGFIREEQRLATKQAHEKSRGLSAYRGTHAHYAHHRGHGLGGHPRAASESAAGDRTPGPLNTSSDAPPSLSPIAQSPVGSVASDTLSTPRPGIYTKPNAETTRSGGNEGTSTSGANPTTGQAETTPAIPTSPTTTTTPSATAHTGGGSFDYFSLKRRPSTAQSNSTAGPADDDFSAWTGPGSSRSSAAHEIPPSTPSTPGGGFMGRLFGKGTRRAATEVETPSVAIPAIPAATQTTESKTEEPEPPPSPPKTLIERLKTQPITPPSNHEAPHVTLPTDTAMIISEELPSGLSPLYCGTVGSVGADAQILEELLPDWLLEFLLANKAPPIVPSKVSFVLLPAQIPPEARDIYGETLPELLNTAQSKLSASRFLRVRKLCYHVQEKLDKNPQSRPSSPRSSTDAINAGKVSLSMSRLSSEGAGSATPSRSSTPRLSPNLQLQGFSQNLPRAEEVYEILCNDQVLSNDMTLAATESPEIRRQGVLDLVARSDKLDVQKYDFLQVRIGRDERPDLFTNIVQDGLDDFWERFEKPYITDKMTSHMDQQSVMSAIEQLLTLNGWVAALCPTLSRPFGQSDNPYDELVRENHLYFVGMVIHSADHFIVDQLAVIVQMARRLGAQNIFVSMMDYDSSDSTETLLDLCESVLTLLGVPFRIRKVPPMTEDPTAAYYPLEEAHTRNLVLEPLYELYNKRKVKFHRVIWLKGFTCPNDIFETITVSAKNDAAMVCGMDWAEHNGFFIFSDRWRTRDINGDQFRQSKSSSAASAGPPRDPAGAARYAQHLPFQVFCCESGTHVVDPAQTYYIGLRYRAGMEIANLSTSDPAPRRPPDAACLDSSQAYFCRDLWLSAAREGVREVEQHASSSTKAGGLGLGFKFGWGSKPTDPLPPVNEAKARRHAKRTETEAIVVEHVKRAGDDTDLQRRQEAGGHAQRQRPAVVDADANVGSDFDAMPDSDAEGDVLAPPEDDDSNAYQDDFSIPNNVFRPARILVNPRCVTTYAGVSHAQLALDLFGVSDDDSQVGPNSREKYVLDDWEGAPESFVCQEQRTTGGRKAPKTQRRLSFSIHAELDHSENDQL
ncbi:hypothetical protein ACEPAF_2087 [Sanghuangporus sanghuang]